jgi:eukaryotic-like serine/threonine-protein kinase
VIRLSPSASFAPKSLGKYTLLGKLTAGGMGEIFLAELEGAAAFRKLCVVKRILPHLADDPQLAEAFFNEARIAARFTHPNVCHVFELGEEEGEYYIAMEYLEGVSLFEMVRAGEVAALSDPVFAVSVVHQACEGLHYVHDLTTRQGEPLGIVHRDVSPSNLFVTAEGIVKVLDFGIAKIRGTFAAQGHSSIKGKFGYMSPEQILGEPPDRRSDIFSIAVVLYELLIGQRLFVRPNDVLIAREILDKPIPPLASRRPDLPLMLSRTLERALAKRPERRFETAREFGQALVRSVGGTVHLPSEIATRLETILAPRVRAQRQVLIDRTLTSLVAPPLEVDWGERTRDGKGRTVKVAEPPVCWAAGSGFPRRDEQRPRRWPWALLALATFLGGVAVTAAYLGA